jgi:hypothetical protein
MSYDQFMEIREPIPASVLHRLVTLELLLSASQGDNPDADEGTPVAWSRIIARDGKALTRWLSLETLTEFDPRACVYRDGSWHVPSPEAPPTRR